MARWRKRLFVATAAVTADAANYFGLPRDRTVILGTRIEVRCHGPARLRSGGPVPACSACTAMRRATSSGHAGPGRATLKRDASVRCCSQV